MHGQPPPARLTVSQLAERLGITPPQVYTLISKGCPYHHGDGEPYLDSAAVDTWIHSTGKSLEELVIGG
jgi:hypothetical protein